MELREALRLLEFDDSIDVGSVSLEAVRAARRRVALRRHPDVGGRHDDMTRINAAFDTVVSHVTGRPSTKTVDAERRPTVDAEVVDIERWIVDRPSFVIDVLPVDAFEWLLLAARVLGEVVDDDPPYVIEVLLESRPDHWCRLEIVPDAGSSTVSIVAENDDPARLVSLWVDTINELATI